MKKQKVFKQVAKHLLAQDERCEIVIDKGVNGCFYRHPEAALKCDEIFSLNLLPYYL